MAYMDLYKDVKFKEKFIEGVDKEYTKIENGKVRDSMVRRCYTLFGDSQLGQYEQIYDKDIYNFTKEELLEAYSNIGFSNLSSIRSIHAMTRKYMGEAFDAGKCSLLVPAHTLIIEEDLKKCLSMNKRYGKYMTKKEIEFAIKRILNDMDKAMIILLYKGLYGVGFSEIIDLQKTNFSAAENYISIYGKRIDLTELESEIINSAINQDTYDVLKTSSTDLSADNYNSYKIPPSRFIFRNFKYYKFAGGEAISDGILKGRIGRLKKENILKPYWTATSIFMSGIAYRMLQIQDEWNNHKEVAAYLEENDINATPYNMIDIIKIVKEKLDIENKAHV